MDSRIEELIEMLSKAGIISQSKLAELQFSTSTNADVESTYTASQLMELGCLTEFQATEISDGQVQKLIVGEYVLLDPIGRGGMGQVYKARHCVMQRDVAIKFMNPTREEDEESARRFRREVQTASKLSHPNIVTALDAGQRDGMSYLVMEYVDGTNLARLIQSRGPMSIERALDCILQAATGLEYSHRHGVVHRDVKPSNLLLTQDDKLKILDMGLARIQPPISSSPSESDEEELTEQGQFLGTIDFMAPEQALDPRTADKRADIYSLGCTLYYLLTGEPPFRGDSVTTRIVAHRERPIPSLREARPDIPADLEHCFTRMMAKDVKDRYQDMADVIRDLKICAQNLSGAVLGNNDTVTWHGPPLNDQADEWRWVRRSALAGGLVLSLLLAGWALSHFRPAPRLEGDNSSPSARFAEATIPQQGSTASNAIEKYPADLLKHIHPERDAVAGVGWELTEMGLLTGIGRAARLQIPIHVPKQYLLTLQVVRREGRGPFLIGLPIDGHQCYVLLDRDGISGIGNNSRNQLLEQTEEIALPFDMPIDIQCRVTDSEIRVSIDEEELMAFAGDLSELKIPEAYKVRRDDIPFIATNRLRDGEDTQFEIPLLTLDSLEKSD